MGLFGSKRKSPELLAEHKFDYINLADFHSHSFWAGFAYVTIYFGILISLCAYAADIYTAANLLIFNKWSSKLQPAVEFSISKWIFAGCIILSFVLLAVEWAIAVNILKGHGVAEIYLNSNAQRWSCVFGGRGRKEDTGWKRFLVFARLTKSKSGVDYIALFTFFSFKGWIRTIFAEGPRQAINALTLYSVMEADIIPRNVKKGEELGAMLKFFENFAALGRQDRVQAFVLGSMLFTLVIWVFAILQLLIAGALYIIYLCHVIGSENGLYGYCKARVDEKLGEIVASNHRKELARQQKADTSKLAEAKRSGNANATLARQPTVPLSLLEESGATEKSIVSIMSHPTDANGNRLPKLPNVAELEKPAPAASQIETQSRIGSTRSSQPQPYGPTRSATSATSDSSKNLLSDQASMGYGGRGLKRNPSSTAASIYTQRSGNDNYGNSESPLTMVAPTMGAPSVGRPTPTPSRQQIRPPPPLAQQGYGGNGGTGHGPGMYGQLQQQFGGQGPQRGDISNYDNGSNYDSPSNYRYNGDQYDEYDYYRYEDNRIYPGAYNNNQIAIPEHQEYTSPVRTQTQHSQCSYGGYNSSSTNTPAPPPQSAYAAPLPPPPLSRALTNTFIPRVSDASSNLSRNQSLASRSDLDDSRSTHQLLLNDFDFELRKKGDGINSGTGNLGFRGGRDKTSAYSHTDQYL
ncbi:hypothetical protein EV426DRAFT_248134 [Tirmania nivea]|nr:hypothetical protein EV426DRAFT_248134 [Tirmania nivea]